MKSGKLNLNKRGKKERLKGKKNEKKGKRKRKKGRRRKKRSVKREGRKEKRGERRKRRVVEREEAGPEVEVDDHAVEIGKSGKCHTILFLAILNKIRETTI